ncbi:hypothetical protein BG543_08245 [Mannheimia haemolytica]|nr:hypothetical protein BG543_08245 [Mannheimia haemolytica]
MHLVRKITVAYMVILFSKSLLKMLVLLKILTLLKKVFGILIMHYGQLVVLLLKAILRVVRYKKEIDFILKVV